MNPIRLIAIKERQALLKDQRGLIWLLVFSIVLSTFSLLLISNTELSLLDNAQVVYLLIGTVTAAGAMISVILGSDAFAGERERGTLVPLLTAPITTAQLLVGKAVGLLTAWAVMYLLALPYLWAVGAGGQNLLQAILYLALFGTPVVLGFGALAMALSARTGSVLISLMTSMTLLLFSAGVPLFLDPSLRDSAIGKALDMINPFATALNTYDSVVVDSEAFSYQLLRLVLGVAWLCVTLIAARQAAHKPSFR